MNSTSTPEKCGYCLQCGGQVYVGLTHQCVTATHFFPPVYQGDVVSALAAPQAGQPAPTHTRGSHSDVPGDTEPCYCDQPAKPAPAAPEVDLVADWRKFIDNWRGSEMAGAVGRCADELAAWLPAHDVKVREDFAQELAVTTWNMAADDVNRTFPQWLAAIRAAKVTP